MSELYSNVNTIWISAENVVYLYSEEEKARKHRVFSSFFVEKSQKNGCFTKHVEIFSGQIKIFFSESGIFSGQVGARTDDVGRRDVKRYLFSLGAFLTFRVTTQVDF